MGFFHWSIETDAQLFKLMGDLFETTLSRCERISRHSAALFGPRPLFAWNINPHPLPPDLEKLVRSPPFLSLPDVQPIATRNPPAEHANIKIFGNNHVVHRDDKMIQGLGYGHKRVP